MEVLIALISGGVAASVVGGIFSVITFKLNRKAQKEDKSDDITSGLRMLLYDRIKHLGKSYITRGNIHAEELEDLIAMHKVYHDTLHGNGFLDELMIQVRHLPIIE